MDIYGGTRANHKPMPAAFAKGVRQQRKDAVIRQLHADRKKQIADAVKPGGFVRAREDGQDVYYANPAYFRKRHCILGRCGIFAIGYKRQ